ncbi:hypothetical protein PBY51_016027 [Eleginops maclovinus]|uniref:Uncharacterized protein n=1 Tax=Eleginops maclovinus TaxID=56733 RepID=A0AAN7XPV5_ELEMC|nr:hypothetical protein PBY51_016027 [Eleginops maclovinus]
MELVPETVSSLGLSQSDSPESSPLCFESAGCYVESKSLQTLPLASAAACPGSPGVSKCAGVGNLGCEAGVTVPL